MSVLIEDRYLNQIKMGLGFPDVDFLLLQDNEICDLCIAPAMNDYFKKFPIKEEYQELMGGNEEKTVKFPSDYVFGIFDCRIVDVGGAVFGQGTSMWDYIMFQSMGGNISYNSSNNGAYGVPKYNPSALIETREMYRNKWKSYQNQYSTIKFHPDFINKEVKIYSSVCGTLNITFAKWSDNFSHIRYEYINDVIDLAKSRLLDHLADTSGILTDTNAEITINSDALRTRASELRDKVLEKWNEIPDVVVIHAV